MFGEPGAGGILEFGGGDNAGAFGYEECVDLSLTFLCEDKKRSCSHLPCRKVWDAAR